jgi:hypothetical protein
LPCLALPSLVLSSFCQAFSCLACGPPDLIRDCFACAYECFGVSVWNTLINYALIA